MTLSDKSCIDCKFYLKSDPSMYPPGQIVSHQGECRKNAPGINGNNTWAQFPLVDETVWCGEFRQGNRLDEVIETMGEES